MNYGETFFIDGQDASKSPSNEEPLEEVDYAEAAAAPVMDNSSDETYEDAHEDEDEDDNGSGSSS